MAKLFFYYAPMNVGKSMQIIASAYSFKERNVPYIVMKSSIDTRDFGVIHSRGCNTEIDCITFNKNENLYNIVQQQTNKPKWILVDESQFLTKQQVDELSDIVDFMDINVICYGLRTDYKTNLFEGSKRLFEVADTIEELKSTCSCGDRKTIFNIRIDTNGNIVTEGKQIEVGSEDKYTTLCRKCYKERMRTKQNEKN